MTRLLGMLEAEKKHCTGCGACLNTCPVDAIHMEKNPQGFFYPVIDSDICIDCKRCENICPKLHAWTGNTASPECYAARAQDSVRKVSSSGGMFTLLAQYILGEAGVVCGAAMEADFQVHHICIDTEDDLDRLRQSKYVQSDTGLVYREIRSYLDDNRKVLFVGCPCQVAAARNYFGEQKLILYVDLLCHGVPSVQMLQDYMRENFNLNQVKEIQFRSKQNGWRSDQLRVFYKDYTSQLIPWEESAYEEGFHRGISLRDGCEDCEFCGMRRQGDLTIGDFWRVEEYDPCLNDGKGTSVVLVNNERGGKVLNQIKGNLYDMQETPIEAARFNRFSEKFEAHPQKERFKLLYPGHSFSDAVMQCRHSLYDIGLVGIYAVDNYGGELTQYALYQTLSDLGYSVLMIAQPLDSIIKPSPKGAHLFERDPYAQWDKSRYFANIAEMKFLNQQCGVFVTGSDQMFNNTLFNEFNKYMTQNFVMDNHCKIAYAASFGHDKIWGTEQERASESFFMRKFDYFSVRETSAVKICKQEFGVDAVQVLDPVFLCPQERFEDLIAIGNSEIPDKPYLFAYILDPDKEKEGVLRNYSDMSRLTIKAIADKYFYSEEDIDGMWDIETVTAVSIESWIAHIAKSEFVITDSFHGMCLAILNHRQFIVIVNKLRGETRFVSLLHLLGLEQRMVYSGVELAEKFNHLPLIDYEKVDRILERERKKSLQWLCNAIEEGKKLKKPLSTFDMTDGRIDELWKRTDRNHDMLCQKIVSLEHELAVLKERLEDRR
ncbi:MAG: polysaccharide pyruvyl transferase family protein [Lachnospiraceae bacterium]|nr:polysaccharide pyruvyl transferase family protein [Lachnospiraceae bacterium]